MILRQYYVFLSLLFLLSGAMFGQTTGINSYADSLDQAIAYWTDSNYTKANHLLSKIISADARTRNYASANARYMRARVLEDLGQYEKAKADLDTIIMYKSSSNVGDVYVYRGILKIDFLNDSTGCEDFRRAYIYGYGPYDGNWRGCEIEELTLNYKMKERFWKPVFKDLNAWDFKLGYFYQGNHGAEIGLLHSNGTWLINWGGSLGVDMLFVEEKSFRPLFAPNLSIEGQYLFGASRLSLQYMPYAGVHDLRLIPQVGISLLAFINLTYGYAIPLRNETQPFLANHRFSIYINFVEISKIGG